MRKEGLAMVVIILLVAASLLTNAWAQSKAVHDKQQFTLPIVTTGDTAAVLKFTPAFGVDSFVYLCTLVTKGGGTDSGEIKWVSPLTVRRFTVDLDDVVPDTAITYACSVDLGTNIYGFEYDPSGLDDTTLALLLDNFVDSIDNVAGVKDTVDAQDSGTYVKLVSKFAQISLEGDARWTLVLGDSVSEMDSSFTTVAMVCDSMPVYVNADDTASGYVTGADGTTFWTVTSDDPGLDFSCYLGDTTQDTTRTQANVTSKSRVIDTILLAQVVGDPTRPCYGAIYGTVVVDSSTTTNKQGIGLSDSCYLYLMAARQVRGGLQYHTVTKDSCAALPCTLEIAQIAALANDSLFKEYFYIIYNVSDTASDTTVNMLHDIYMDYLLFER